MTATAGGAALLARRDGFGMLEVERPPGGASDITLTHVPGWAEWTGALLSALSAAMLTARGILLVNRGRHPHDASA